MELLVFKNYNSQIYHFFSKTHIKMLFLQSQMSFYMTLLSQIAKDLVFEAFGRR